MIMNWKDSGAPTKSDGEVNRLVKDVLLEPGFKLEDLRGFSVARENQQSDAAEKKSPFLDSFQTANINIEVRVALLESDRYYPSCIHITSCFSLPSLPF